MKKTALFLAAVGVATVATAQEQGRVLSATPVVQQVGIPQQVCDNEAIYSGSRNSGAGALLGAIAGGAAGNAVGRGGGRAGRNGGDEQNLHGFDSGGILVRRGSVPAEGRCGEAGMPIHEADMSEDIGRK